MNPASGKSGGFRNFASKLREQAKVVKQYKLPTFDDMAKNDEYFHSPDFNVRGSALPEKNISSQDGETSENQIHMNGAVDEASYYSSESSWSLLDRPSSILPVGNPTMATNSIDATEEKQIEGVIRNHRSQQDGNNSSFGEVIDAPGIPQRSFEQRKEAARPSAIPNSAISNVKKSSVSLLSVVSDTLQSTTSVSASLPGVTKDHNESDRAKYRESATYHHKDDSSDESSGISDEEDPILSMLGKSNDKSKSDLNDGNRDMDGAPASVITIKKSSNRFMEDLRLQTDQQDQSFDIIAKMQSVSTGTTESETVKKDSNKVGMFGGHFKDAAIRNFNRIILRRESEPQNNNDRVAPPPLARFRATKPELGQQETFQITASTSAGMLGDDELERLKQMKISGNSSSTFSLLTMIQASIQTFIEYVREHRHFLFIAFTLLISIYVYFRQAIASKSI